MKLDIIDYGYSGEGVGKFKGKVCFVPLTIKGEQVEASPTKETSSFCKCKLSKVIEPSSKRKNPPCPYFGGCGGCSFQHVQYDDEIEIKLEMLTNQFKKIGYINPIEVQKSDKEYNYRNKIKLFTKENLLSLNRLESNNLVPIEKCMICENVINDAISKIQTFISAKNIGCNIENVIIQTFDGKILTNFILKKRIKIEFSGLQIMLGANAGIFVSIKGETTSKHVHGISKIQINGKLKQTINVSTFHQVNEYVQTKLYDEILGYASDKLVINAYSGAGYLSALLADKSKLVYGIELGKSEHQDAEKLKEINGIFNLTNMNDDCAIAFESLKSIKAELVILDPPKAGCNSTVLDVLNEMEVKNIIYISCNPATLVRDLKLLTNFEIQNVKMFDMFPRTASIETFVILNRRFENK